jgi:hypothetical protein
MCHNGTSDIQQTQLLQPSAGLHDSCAIMAHRSWIFADASRYNLRYSITLMSALILQFIQVQRHTFALQILLRDPQKRIVAFAFC